MLKNEISFEENIEGIGVYDGDTGKYTVMVSDEVLSILTSPDKEKRTNQIEKIWKGIMRKKSLTLYKQEDEVHAQYGETGEFVTRVSAEDLDFISNGPLKEVLTKLKTLYTK